MATPRPNHQDQSEIAASKISREAIPRQRCSREAIPCQRRAEDLTPKSFRYFGSARSKFFRNGGAKGTRIPKNKVEVQRKSAKKDRRLDRQLGPITEHLKHQLQKAQGKQSLGIGERRT